MSELPTGWEWSTFGEICENHDGRRVPVKASDRQNMSGEFPYYGASGVIDHVDDFLFDGTYLLVSEDGANLLARSKPIAFEASGRFWVNNHAHVVKAWPGIAQRFVLHAIERLDLSAFVSGTAQPKITQANLAKVPIPVPPTTEQRRIVAAIEEHFSRLDAIDANLKQALQRINHLRTATLQTAIEGAPLRSMNDISIGMRYGTSVKCAYDGHGPAVMRIPNVVQGRLSLDDLKYATDPGAVAESAYARPGEVLFVRTNGSRDLIGRSACIPEGPSRAFASYLIGVQLDESQALPAYVNLAMHAPRIRRQLVGAASTTAGQYNLNIGKIGATELPVPDLAEQRAIVREVDALQFESSRLTLVLEQSVRRSSVMRRSILAAAFSGRLVPQNPSDEPASRLLKRVVAERAAAMPTRREKQAAT